MTLSFSPRRFAAPDRRDVTFPRPITVEKRNSSLRPISQSIGGPGNQPCILTFRRWAHRGSYKLEDIWSLVVDLGIIENFETSPAEYRCDIDDKEVRDRAD